MRRVTSHQIAANQVVPLAEPARRGLVNAVTDVAAASYQAVAAAAHTGPRNMRRVSRGPPAGWPSRHGSRDSGPSKTLDSAAACPWLCLHAGRPISRTSLRDGFGNWIADSVAVAPLRYAARTTWPRVEPAARQRATIHTSEPAPSAGQRTSVGQVPRVVLHKSHRSLNGVLTTREPDNRSPHSAASPTTRQLRGAVAAMPMSSRMPWHRVIDAQGRPGSFAAGSRWRACVEMSSRVRIRSSWAESGSAFRCEPDSFRSKR
jgi:hypothetical protein